MKKSFALFFSLTLLFALNACAQPGGGPGGDQGRGTPPAPPFVKACASLSEGASCSFSDRDGTKITGKCIMKTNPRGNKELVCYNESFFKKMEFRRDGGQFRPEQQ